MSFAEMSVKGIQFGIIYFNKLFYASNLHLVMPEIYQQAIMLSLFKESLKQKTVLWFRKSRG